MERFTSFRVEMFTDGDFTITCKAIFGKELEAWISHKDYGVAHLMFSTPIQNMTMKEFISMVEANLYDAEELYLADMEGETT